jgi:hypothetical protein
MAEIISFKIAIIRLITITEVIITTAHIIIVLILMILKELALIELNTDMISLTKISVRQLIFGYNIHLLQSQPESKHYIFLLHN